MIKAKNRAVWLGLIASMCCAVKSVADMAGRWNWLINTCTGAAAAVGAFFATALLVDAVALLLLAGALALLAVTGPASSALATALPQRRPMRRALAASVAGGMLLLTGLFTAQFILTPMAFPES